MKRIRGSVIQIGPYRLVLDIAHLGRWDRPWKLKGEYKEGTIEVINHITKRSTWNNRESLKKALESGDFILISRYPFKWLYDGRCDKGKYEIRHIGEGVMGIVDNIIRWLWRNW